jgi:glycine/D-amino acid oxidase-like deaminating enzyme
LSRAPDAIVIGAGIVGAACARACAREGLRVLVVDRNPVGSGTTAAGMGHLVVMDDSDAQFALTAYSCRLWRELREVLPPEVEYDACGTLWVAADDEELEEVHRKARYYRERGVAAEVLDAKAVAEAEPQLRRGLAGGLRVPGDAVIYPPCAAAFLLAEARRHQADFECGTGVVAIESGAVVRLADGRRIAAGLVINAAGAQAPALDPTLPIKKRKGHLVITDRYPGFARHQLIELGYLKSAHATQSDSVAFNIQPRRTGQMLIGSSRQFNADGTEVEPGVLGRMLRRVEAYMPGIARLSALRVWTGHRAATPDKLPLIGPSASDERTWVASGHEGLGITTSLATAEIVVDRHLGRAPAIPAEPYDPARYDPALLEARHG